MNWNNVEQKPESGKHVLLRAVHNNTGKVTIMVGFWVSEHSIESNPEDDFGDYDEETDEYYCPEGWYESIHNWIDYSSVQINEYTVSHWMDMQELLK